MSIHDDAVKAAVESYETGGDMQAALQAALKAGLQAEAPPPITPEQKAAAEEALGDRVLEEFAVPCLDKDAPCRRIFTDRQRAEEFAAREGGVIEIRLVTPWRPR